MCDHRPFIEALRDFHADIAAGKFSRHVGAYVLKKAHDGTFVELQEVPVHEWTLPEENETELDAAVATLLNDVLHEDGTLSFVQATEILKSVHMHIDDARERLLSTPLKEISSLRNIASKLAKCHPQDGKLITTVGDVWQNRTSFTSDYYTKLGLTATSIQRLMETVRKLTLCPA